MREYLIDFHATRAALAAGYSPKTARSQASRLLTDVDIAARVKEAIDARNLRNDVSADAVLRDINVAAHLDSHLLFDNNGNLHIRSLKDIPIEVRRCITSIKVVKRNLVVGDGKMDDVYEVKLIDKAKMYELLAKATGLTRDELQKPASDVPAFALPPETPGVSVH